MAIEYYLRFGTCYSSVSLVVGFCIEDCTIEIIFSDSWMHFISKYLWEHNEVAESNDRGGYINAVLTRVVLYRVAPRALAKPINFEQLGPVFKT